MATPFLTRKDQPAAIRELTMSTTTRRDFLALAGVSSLASAIPTQAAVMPKIEKDVAWYDVENWGVEGRGWPETEMESFYDRLPKKAKGKVRDAVWNLSRNSSGMLTRFRSNATKLRVRYRLTSERIAMPHMPATGVSGVDLYALDEERKWRWVSVSRPGARDVNVEITNGLDPFEKTFMAYLPLYNGVEKLEIGLPPGATFAPVAPRTAKPIIFYGTSITHGACASRPGMCHPAILGRWLNRPVLNLGFSGNGRLEAEVGKLLAEIDPAVYVIDCLPNVTGDIVAQRTEPLVAILRKARPETPIVLVEDRTYDYAWIKAGARDRHRQSRAALKAAYLRLVAAGDTNLHYLEGANLLGHDGDGTTDGSHPNDLGFYRQARAFLPVLRDVLG